MLAIAGFNRTNHRIPSQLPTVAEVEQGFAARYDGPIMSNGATHGKRIGPGKPPSNAGHKFASILAITLIRTAGEAGRPARCPLRTQTNRLGLRRVRVIEEVGVVTDAQLVPGI